MAPGGVKLLSTFPKEKPSIDVAPVIELAALASGFIGKLHGCVLIAENWLVLTKESSQGEAKDWELKSYKKEEEKTYSMKDLASQPIILKVRFFADLFHRQASRLTRFGKSERICKSVPCNYSTRSEIRAPLGLNMVIVMDLSFLLIDNFNQSTSNSSKLQF
ncbi:hypothetical protein LXL04_005310 [Taraxacum kok-saghyz]